MAPTAEAPAAISLLAALPGGQIATFSVADLVAAMGYLPPPSPALAALSAPAEPPALLTADQAAKLLSISRASFFRGIAANTLPAAVQSPGGPRYKRSEILKAIERMRTA